MRTYFEMCDDIKKVKWGKEARELHKEMKLAKKDGLPLFMRYPKLPDYVMAITAVAEVIVLVVILLTRL